MRKTGIDFERIDRDYYEIKLFAKDVIKSLWYCMRSFGLIAISLLAMVLYRLVILPMRIYKEYQQFKEFKKMCEIDEQMSFDNLRRTGHI